MKTPHFKVRNPLVYAPQRGRCVRQYRMVNGKLIEVYRDPSLTGEPKLNPEEVEKKIEEAKKGA